jgi:hypothetical protein
MEADTLAEVGHQGFVMDALGMTALLFDFATRPDYRALVKREFEETRALQAEYLKALEKPYQIPKVPDPR